MAVIPQVSVFSGHRRTRLTGSTQLPKLNTRVRFPSSAHTVIGSTVIGSTIIGSTLTSNVSVRTVRLASVAVTECHNSVQSVTLLDRTGQAAQLEPARCIN